MHVREYCAQAPPQEMSPRLKSVPTSRSSRRSSCCSDTTSHRWIVGLVALAILARTWGGKKSTYLCVYTDYGIEQVHAWGSDGYLADKQQQVGVAGEVHGEEEEGQLLHHRDAALMGQGEGQGLYFWGFFGCAGLRVQRGAGPLGRPPQTDQVFKVLEERRNQMNPD